MTTATEAAARKYLETKGDDELRCIVASAAALSDGAMPNF